MKKIAYLALFMITISSCVDKKVEDLYTDTFVSVLNNSDKGRKEVTGKVNDTISNNVIRILFEVENNVSTLEKLDLLMLMIYYQSSSTKITRAKLLNRENIIDLSNQSRCLFLSPLSQCYYCKGELISNCNFEELDRASLGTEYNDLYDNLYELQNTSKNDANITRLILKVVYSKNFRDRNKKYLIKSNKSNW